MERKELSCIEFSSLIKTLMTKECRIYRTGNREHMFSTRVIRNEVDGQIILHGFVATVTIHYWWKTNIIRNMKGHLHLQTSIEKDTLEWAKFDTVHTLNTDPLLTRSQRRAILEAKEEILERKKQDEVESVQEYLRTIEKIERGLI